MMLVLPSGCIRVYPAYKSSHRAGRAYSTGQFSTMEARGSLISTWIIRTGHQQKSTG